MARLLSLPNEVLIKILIASPTTRTLLHLSRLDHRMRSIWLEHSHHIVLAKYKAKIPHIDQAIALTLTEFQYGELPLDIRDCHTAPEASPVHLCLPRVLRNAGLASSVCDAASKDNKLEKITWQTKDPRVEMLRAYYFVRHALLAYDHTELRPALISALKGMSEQMCDANDWMRFFMRSAAPKKLRHAHGVYERNPDAWNGSQRDPYEQPLRLTARWRAVGIVLAGAISPDGEPPGFDFPQCDLDE